MLNVKPLAVAILLVAVSLDADEPELMALTMQKPA